MSRRSEDWNIGLAKDLQDPEFVREFIIAGLEEDIPLQDILGKVIRCLGVKKFAKRVNMPSSNILRSVNPKQNVTQETLNRLLKPFGLKLWVAPAWSGQKGKKAA